jgi:CheY-like chemotaxis protein
MLTALLADAGLEVVVAGTAAEAVERGRELHPRAIVLDQRLPDGSGVDVVAELRRDHRSSRATLIVYSANDVAPDMRADFELGPTAFLTKGRVPPEALRDQLLALLDGTPGGRHDHHRG